MHIRGCNAAARVQSSPWPSSPELLGDQSIPKPRRVIYFLFPHSLSCLILLCPVLPGLDQSCPVLFVGCYSCPMLSCPTLTSPVKPCPSCLSLGNSVVYSVLAILFSPVVYYTLSATFPLSYSNYVQNFLFVCPFLSRPVSFMF
jgi:hypothetical protein